MMLQRYLLVAPLLMWGGVAAAQTLPTLSAEQIVDKNVAAHGGITAWHAVTTLKTEGKMDAGGKPNQQLPYVLRQKRPLKSRLEIVFKEQTALQVFDGTQGWKVRPFLNRDQVEDFSPEETEAAATAEPLDGPLLDHAAKGTTVSLAGQEVVEGHPAYKLQLTSRALGKRYLWIDGSSFLEVKMQGLPRKLDGKLHNVAIYYRDYQTDHGLTLAHLQETAVEGVKVPYKLTISKIAINEPMDDSVFAKPHLAAALAGGK